MTATNPATDNQETDRPAETVQPSAPPAAPLDQLAHDLLEDHLDHLGLGQAAVEATWATVVADPEKLTEARCNALFVAKLVRESGLEPSALARLHELVRQRMAGHSHAERVAVEQGNEVGARMWSRRVDELDWVLQRLDEVMGR